MSCLICTQTLTPDLYSLMHKACSSCRKQLTHMKAGFNGVVAEPQKIKTIWDNTEAFESWKRQLTSSDLAIVHLRKKDDDTLQRCDIRDMRDLVGWPKMLPLEDQVFTAWVLEGHKDERIQEVLGLTYSQLFAIKNVVKKRLQKQMAYFRQVKKLNKENKT